MSDEAAVALVGSGPAAAAVEAALTDGDHDAARVEAADADPFELAVVVGPAGDARFDRANASRSAPWVAVELGGVGGRAVPGVDAAVSVLDPDGPCYDCLRSRVVSTEQDEAAGGPRTARADARLAGAHAGRLAVQLLDGAAQVGTVLELPYQRRRLLAVPGCACEGERDGALDREHEAVPLEPTIERAEGAVDQRLGPVQSVGEAESFPAPYYLATVADTSGFSDAQASRQAAGVAADWNPAFVKAVGEALERYAAGVYREETFTVAPAGDLADAVSPEWFVRPEDDEEVAAADGPVQWVPGEDLHTGEAVQLPAERVLFPPPAERFGPAITTGLGLGTSGAGALVSGLTEVVERDATMLGWYSTFEPLALSVDDPGYNTLERRARAEDLRATALLMTQDVDLPVVTVAVHREGDWPRFAVGSGAALDPVAAATAALEEAVQNWTELRGMGPEGAAEEEPHLARYAERPSEAAALIDAEGPVPAASVGPDEPPTGAAVLPALLERLEDGGLDAYAARLTTRDLESLGFEAVRVLVPAAQPLFTGERFFGERARTVPRELGYRPRFDRAFHPYP
ncbi:MAG: YcaO-like family protein [Halobacteriales archaeon]|nr:YcaO-like family protein [Halobacteriales archaeon]